MAMKVIPADKNHRIKYLYDEEATGVRNGYPYKGIVIAIMGDKKTSVHPKRDVINILVDYEISTDAKCSDLCIKDSYKGISYCSIDDKFDLKEGMKVARGKLLDKYYKDEIAALNKAIKDIQKNLDNAMRAKADIQKILDNHSN